MTGRTLFQKIWDAHVVERLDDGSCLLSVDREMIYEGALPAFSALADKGRTVRHPANVLAVADHSVATVVDLPQPAFAEKLAGGLARECEASGIEYLGLDDERRGIVHVIGPEQGFTQPGMVIACPDSHTSSHGALGAVAFGVGASELAHILATQTVLQRQAPSMRVTIKGSVSAPVSAKDVILAVIGHIGVDGAVGRALELAGPVVEGLDIPGRLTMCNMGVEAGARYALVAPDDVTYAWLEGRPRSPKGPMWDEAMAHWRTLHSDADAVFTPDIELDLGELKPQVTWGTAPDQVVDIDGVVPEPRIAGRPDRADAWSRALDYMALSPGDRMQDVRVDRVFIGSCTNSRLEDLRAAASLLKGHRVDPAVDAMVVPGSGAVKKAAEAEGLHEIFLDAGFEWRMPGCSMCFGNPNDSVAAGERCASTSNRNFENRQGPGARTHLVSPASAAAVAVAGHFVDPRELM